MLITVAIMYNSDEDQEQVDKLIDANRKTKDRQLTLSDKIVKFFPDHLTDHDWVRILFAKNCKLVSLQYLPPNLKVLVANDNFLKTDDLMSLPNTLENLIVGNNKIDGLTPLPLSLITAMFNKNNLNDNDIKLLLKLPKLKHLNISFNPAVTKFIMNSEYESWNSIRFLDIKNCSIIELGDLPENLATLDASHNQLKWAKHLPDSLTNLNLSNNCLFIPPKIPAKIKYLNLSHNQLPFINAEIPDSIQELNISFNKIKGFCLERLTARIETIIQGANGNVEHFIYGNEQAEDYICILAKQLIAMAQETINQNAQNDTRELLLPRKNNNFTVKYNLNGRPIYCNNRNAQPYRPKFQNPETYPFGNPNTRQHDQYIPPSKCRKYRIRHKSEITV